MDFEEITELLKENLILEKRSYKHRPGYEGNEKGSYIEKGKTYWDYSGGATPGNERLVTQIQSKSQKKYDKYLSRREIKKYLKTEASQKLYNKLEAAANSKFGRDREDPRWKAYTYGGLATAVARILSSDKNDGLKYLI